MINSSNKKEKTTLLLNLIRKLMFHVSYSMNENVVGVFVLVFMGEGERKRGRGAKEKGLYVEFQSKI